MFRKSISLLWRLLSSLQRILANLLVLLLVLLLLALLITSLTLLKPAIPDQAVLALSINGALSEQVTPPSLSSLPFALPKTSQTSMPDVEQALRRAAVDPRIRGVWIDVDGMAQAPLGRLKTIITAIDRFRSSGKPVAIYGDSFSPSQYLVATAADTITLHPTGLVALTGPVAMRHYFKNSLDKLSVEMQLFRSGRYKSFAEPMTRNSMSAAARQATEGWINQWWQQIKQRLQQRRGIKATRVQQLLDHPQQIVANSHGDLATLELKEGLVDQLGDRFEANKAFDRRLGDERLPRIDWNDYLLASQPVEQAVAEDAAQIAIIRASGEIVSGKEPASAIAGDALSSVIDTAADNEAIAAVVLRIDSPGGSATASETIHRALLRLKKSGKPLVISMGAIAASGGYWIASAGDEIWAQPATLTGSIGVFAMVPDLSASLQRVGVQLDGVQTTALSAIRVDRPLDAAQKALLQSGVEFIYRTFLQRVAEGRHLPLATVEKLAAGRVWSAVDAKQMGLVDHLGNLQQAIAAAAQRVGAKSGHYRTIDIGTDSGWWKLLSEQLMGAALTLLPQEGVMLLRQLQGMATLRDPRGIYAYAEL